VQLFECRARHFSGMRRQAGGTANRRAQLGVSATIPIRGEAWFPRALAVQWPVRGRISRSPGGHVRCANSPLKKSNSIGLNGLGAIRKAVFMCRWRFFQRTAKELFQNPSVASVSRRRHKLRRAGRPHSPGAGTPVDLRARRPHSPGAGTPVGLRARRPHPPGAGTPVDSRARRSHPPGAGTPVDSRARRPHSPGAGTVIRSQARRLCHSYVRSPAGRPCHKI